MSPHLVGIGAVSGPGSGIGPGGTGGSGSVGIGRGGSIGRAVVDWEPHLDLEVAPGLAAGQDLARLSALARGQVLAHLHRDWVVLDPASGQLLCSEQTSIGADRFRRG